MKLTNEELRQKVRTADMAMPIGSTLRHRERGGVYHVMSIALRESDLVPLISYRSADSLVIFSRPLAETLEKFEFITRPNVMPTTKDIHKS